LVSSEFTEIGDEFSDALLADQLRQLDGDGVLTRKVTVTNPPQVTYSLNAEDKKLVPLNGNSL